MALLAYFDYLGFTDFIARNDAESQQRVMDTLFRDIESALSKGKLKETNRGYVADLSESKLNCVNFSDTVIFWSNDQSLEALTELLDVSLRFNWICIDFSFPIKGAIVLGEISYYRHDYENKFRGTYRVNSMIGKGLVSAYEKTKIQNWAGTVIDDSVIQYLRSIETDEEVFLSQFAKKYKVPYHDHNSQEDEWVLKLVTSSGKLNDEAYNNMKKNIEKNFTSYNKRTDSEIVQTKLANTMRFLESFR